MTLSPETQLRLSEHAYLVARDVRPAAMEAIAERHVPEVRKIARAYGVHVLVEDLSEGWKTVWLYKWPHIRFVIVRTESRPATAAFDHWLMGKLFGYSEAAIADFLTRDGLAHLSELSTAAFGAWGKRVGGVVQPDQLTVPDAPVRSLARFLTRCWHLYHLVSCAGVRCSTLHERSRRVGQNPAAAEERDPS